MSYLINFLGGIKRRPSGNLFAQTSNSTIADTVTETTMIDGGDGSLVLPANFFRVGRTLRIFARGIHSSTGNPTVTIKVKLGSTVIAQGSAAGGNGSSDGWDLVVDLTCRSIGGSAQIMGVGYYNEHHSNGAKIGILDQGATINSGSSQTVDLTFTWGTADVGNTITTQIFLCDAIN